MLTLDKIPEYIRRTFSEKERKAIELFADCAEDIKIFFQAETGEFDCIGFIGPGGKVTKFADLERYKAIIVLEDRVRFELRSSESRYQGRKWL